MRSCSDVPANCPRRYTNMDSHQYYQNHHPTATSSPQSTSPSPHPTPPNSAPKKQHKKIRPHRIQLPPHEYAICPYFFTYIFTFVLCRLYLHRPLHPTAFHSTSPSPQQYRCSYLPPFTKSATSNAPHRQLEISALHSANRYSTAR